MDGEPTPVADMTDAEFADFANELRVLVVEEAYLWELPAGCRDSLGNGEWLQHGPWRQEDCAAAVKRWFDAGLVSLLRRWPEEEPVPVPTAGEVLDIPQSWVLRPDGSTNIALVATDAGEAVAWNEWTALLAGLRQG